MDPNTMAGFTMFGLGCCCSGDPGPPEPCETGAIGASIAGCPGLGYDYESLGPTDNFPIFGGSPEGITLAIGDIAGSPTSGGGPGAYMPSLDQPGTYTVTISGPYHITQTRSITVTSPCQNISLGQIVLEPTEIPMRVSVQSPCLDWDDMTVSVSGTGGSHTATTFAQRATTGEFTPFGRSPVFRLPRGDYTMIASRPGFDDSEPYTEAVYGCSYELTSYAPRYSEGIFYSYDGSEYRYQALPGSVELTISGSRAGPTLDGTTHTLDGDGTGEFLKVIPGNPYIGLAAYYLSVSVRGQLGAGQVDNGCPSYGAQVDISGPDVYLGHWTGFGPGIELSPFVAYIPAAGTSLMPIAFTTAQDPAGDVLFTVSG